MNKRTLIKAMTAAALLGTIALPAQAATNFNDIDGSFAKDAINKLVESGIINGTGNGKFSPQGQITRQDFAIILAKALKLDVDHAPATASFSDIPTTHYAFKYVEAAVQAGLIKGEGNGQFGLGQNLSRQDMAVLFTRALGTDVTGYGANLKFSDSSSIADYAKDAVGAAVQLGLLNGVGNNTFNPTGSADRASVAAVASKFLDTYKAKQEQNTSSNPPAAEQQPQTTTPAPAPSAPASTATSSSSSNGSSSESYTPVYNDTPSYNDIPSSEADRVAPTVRLLSVPTITLGQFVTVSSNELGTVYLVPFAQEPSSKSALDELVSSNQAKKAAVATVNAETLLSTEGLPAGNYKVYALDASGNVSASTSKIELKLAELNSPTVSFAEGDLITLAYDEPLDLNFVPTAEDLTVTVKDGDVLPLTHEDITVDPERVEIKLPQLMQPGQTVIVTYSPKQADNQIRGISGRLAPSFTGKQLTYGFTEKQSELQEKLTSAKSTLDSAPIGTTTGKYPQDAADTLNTAIEHAQNLLSGTETTYAELDSTIQELDAALITFQAAEIKPLQPSLVTNDAFEMKTKGIDTESDVQILDSEGMDGTSDSYNTRNIDNLLQISRGGVNESLRYNDAEGAHYFEIVDENDAVLGTVSISVEVETPFAFLQATGPHGMVVIPTSRVTVNTQAALVFTIKEEGREDVKVNLPMIIQPAVQPQP
ncbi:hypothetical protein DCC85_21520 [Paenibacillus sp. CAA11]|uniref:S-layer homology domain-containing protein n=1 Tax=Paenibacillus sp. CAA11 TaxID=1532905 RepID=UPI000D3D7D40|nr:S-layer homology domain-containing protein [Paenibacillus sp. CAA11]AWB46491.1 hypothetical protein DCC85_21520 [Paenibacillus sp. CAA11]